MGAVGAGGATHLVRRDGFAIASIPRAQAHQLPLAIARQTRAIQAVCVLATRGPLRRQGPRLAGDALPQPQQQRVLELQVLRRDHLVHKDLYLQQQVLHANQVLCHASLWG